MPLSRCERSSDPMKVDLLLVFLMVITLAFGDETTAMPNMTRASLFRSLKTKLFNVNYDRALHPVGTGMGQFDPAMVRLKIAIMNIEEVSTSHQTFTSLMRLNMSWSDMVLTWQPEDFGNISYLQVEQQQVWVPDITIGNTQGTNMNLGYGTLPIMLSSNGTIQWEPMQRVTTSCQVDVTYFPFDAQVCKVRIRTYISRVKDVMFYLSDKDVFVDELGYNGQWELVTTKAMEVDSIRPTYDVFIQLRRRRTYHLFNLVIPVLFLSLTGALVFMVPVDAGEKMGLSITVLLAFAVYLTIVFEQLPETSLQVSILIVYLTILLGTSALSVVVSVFVLRYYHTDPARPVPIKTAQWIKSLVRLMKTNDLDPDPPSNHDLLHMTLSDLETINYKTKTGTANHGTVDHENLNGEKNNQKGDSKLDDNEFGKTGIAQIRNLLRLNKVGVEEGQDPTGVREAFGYLGDKDAAPRVGGGRREVTWKIVSTVLDKFLFRFFLSVLVLDTVVCMSILTIGGACDAGGIALPV